MNKVLQIYKTFLKSYGPQGWWPLQELNNMKNIKITKSGSIKGYHPGDYSYPKTDTQRFEICVGAILTQYIGNTKDLLFPDMFSAKGGNLTPPSCFYLFNLFCNETFSHNQYGSEYQGLRK